MNNLLEFTRGSASNKNTPKIRKKLFRFENQESSSIFGPRPLAHLNFLDLEASSGAMDLPPLVRPEFVHISVASPRLDGPLIDAQPPGSTRRRLVSRLSGSKGARLLAHGLRKMEALPRSLVEPTSQLTTRTVHLCRRCAVVGAHCAKTVALCNTCPRGPGCQDADLPSRLANLATCLPFFALGMRVLR